MNIHLQELLASTPSAEALDAFMANHDFPLVDESSVTFVYRGEADQVELRHFVYGLESSQPFSRAPGTDLWLRTLTLPANSRVEYKLDVIREGRHHWIRDPLNPDLAFDPFGANSVCSCSGYQRPDWTFEDPQARKGRIESFSVESRSFGEQRPLQVYLPARYRPSRSYPLLVVHDGDDYLRYSGLDTVLDNLIHRLEIPPLVVALTTSPDRLKEYAGDPDHARFVVEDLLPTMEERYSLFPGASSRCLMGASFGGVATLSTAWRFPGVFGRLLLQSGSFAFTDIGNHERGPAFDPVVEFVNAFRKQPGKPTDKAFLSCGMHESLIYENRSLIPILQKAGLEVRFEEARDGHNWENWRDRLRKGLSWLFPGPLWMVYE